MGHGSLTAAGRQLPITNDQLQSPRTHASTAIPRSAQPGHVRRDAARSDVFLMGEEVAEYDGAYKVSQGMLASWPMRSSIRPSPRRASPAWRRRRHVGMRPIIEFMTFSFSLVAFDQVVNNAPRWLTCPADSSRFRSCSRHLRPWTATRRTTPGPSMPLHHIPGLKVVCPPPRRS